MPYLGTHRLCAILLKHFPSSGLLFPLYRFGRVSRLVFISSFLIFTRLLHDFNLMAKSLCQTRSGEVRQPDESKIPGMSMSIKSLRLDSDPFHLHLGPQSIRLTKREFEILKRLLNCDERYVERQELLKSVWGPHCSVEIRTVDSHVVRLRKKIRQVGGSNGPTIETVWGLGYLVRY